jgi:general secretion pathway protein L
MLIGESAPEIAQIHAGGVWALTGDGAIIADPDGPATVLVPSESVLLLAVDLPLATHARRLAALPFAIEDRIADPLDAVHVALGAEIAPGRYLAAVVRHARMAEWVAAAEANGLGQAAMMPDALALPVPPAGAWSAESVAGRVLARVADGTGFAMPAALLPQFWENAGRPAIRNFGSESIGELPQSAVVGESLSHRLAQPPVDLRQGAYARRGGSGSRWVRRLGWIAAAGIAAHVVIAAADTVMLHVIAERRADDLRAAVAQAAPGASLGEDLRNGVADMLPAPGPAGGAFVPLVNRTARALAPLSGSVSARAMRFEGDALVMELEPGGPELAGRVRGAMQAAGVAADVAAGADGALRVTVRA